MAVHFRRENPPPTQNCARENYFRFGSAILEIDAGLPTVPGIVDRVEIDQQTAKIWPKDGRVRLDQSISTMSSTRRIIECTIGFDAVPGVREVSHVILALVDLRLDELRGNPAWRQQTGSSNRELCLMFPRIGRVSGGRGRPGKHVSNTGNHSRKQLLVCTATVEFDGNRLHWP